MEKSFFRFKYLMDPRLRGDDNGEEFYNWLNLKNKRRNLMTHNDLDIFARTLYGEARGEYSKEGPAP